MPKKIIIFALFWIIGGLPHHSSSLTSASTGCGDISSSTHPQHRFICDLHCEETNSQSISFDGTTLMCSFPEKSLIPTNLNNMFFYQGTLGSSSRLSNVGIFTSPENFGAESITWCMGSESDNVPNPNGDDCVSISTALTEYLLPGNASEYYKSEGNRDLIDLAIEKGKQRAPGTDKNDPAKTIHCLPISAKSAG